ncbi:HsdR family type I site-specific deoxyribonuclease [Candidatus Poribacteria bacterium]|nr:HsdR family type I site-specific deoxyribonuclease [Candidatus Poribacteria bacterium]
MSERSAVQEPLIQYAEQVGWTRLSRSEAMRLRGNTAAIYIQDVLKKQLLELNPDIIDDSNIEEITRQLGILKSTLESNQTALEWLRGEKSVFVPIENRERNVTLIDFESPKNNTFHVTDEWEQKGVVHTNRADVVFLINGIPIVIVETKSANKSDGLSEGIDQIRRYHTETPELFTTAQLFGVTQLLDIYYGVTWNINRKNLFNWKAEDTSDFEQKVKSFFQPERILSVLHRSIIFQKRDDKTTKIVLRQHQDRAEEKVIERVNDKNKTRGLIWHTQGSGKTLTMISIASRLLRGTVQEEKPTVLMVVDRNELESQLFHNITGYGITNLKVAQSKNDLEQILSSDYRGLIVSMIHKFDSRPANLNTNTNVVILIDEAHRTTGGDFGNYLIAALPNATYIGFTGTPIDNLSKGEGTFKVFGKDDEQGYLDKYDIAESIEDGTTVPLNYTHAPSNLQVDTETLDREFMNLSQTEGVSDIDELNSILDHAVNLKEIMKAPNRVDAIAKYVAKHYKENIEPMGFKGFLVGVDREACALYKKALDKHLPPEYSEVVYSKNTSDSESMKSFHLTDEQEKDIRKKFVDKNSQPKILIVTQKLLTGFDAPILYCLYLDKPMRDHVLLQTIARVNRPYEDDEGLVKSTGLIMDFVGILEKLSTAMAFNSDTVKSVIQNIDVLKDRFSDLMNQTAQEYLPYAKGIDDKAKEEAIEHFTLKDDREKFFEFFKQLQSLYNILSPDPFLRDYIDDFRGLANLYGLLRNAFSENSYVDKELTNKTRELLQSHTEGEMFDLPNEITELNEDTIRELRQSDTKDTVKVLNLIKVVRKTVDADAEFQPYLIPIGDRVEATIESYENRQTETQDVLEQFMKYAEEISQAHRQQNLLGLDENSYAIYTILNNEIQDVTTEQAHAVNQVFEQFPNYTWNQQQERDLRNTLYQTLAPSVDFRIKIEITNKLLNLKRV